MATDELHITYRRSGGFAGVVMAAECLAAELPADQAQVASQLLAGTAEGGHEGAPEEGTRGESAAHDAAPTGADQFIYTIEVEQGSRRRRLSWSDTTVPDAARPLLATLGGLARPTRNG